MTTWLGAAFAADSRSGFTGATYAPNGDVWGEGFLVRVGLGAGSYAIDLPGDERASFEHAEITIGYQKLIEDSRVAVFVGPDYTYTDDPNPDVRGASWGIRGIVDAYVPLVDRLELTGWGTITSNFTQYYAQGRILYRIQPQVKLGPEFADLGGDEWHQIRGGGYAALETGFGELGISAGYAWDLDGESDGAYVTTILSINLD